MNSNANHLISINFDVISQGNDNFHLRISIGWLINLQTDMHPPLREQSSSLVVRLARHFSHVCFDSVV